MTKYRWLNLLVWQDVEKDLFASGEENRYHNGPRPMACRVLE
jgi:hypothetical protein